MRKVLVVILLLLTSFWTFAGGNTEDYPIKVRENVTIPDGEHLHYTMYSGGEEVGEVEIITRISEDNIAETKVKIWDTPYSDTSLPPYKFIEVRFNLGTGSMTYYKTTVDDYYIEEENYHGIIFEEINVSDNIIGLRKYWDGYEFKESRIRIKNIKVDYPIWEWESLLYYGARLLDWQQGGYYYVWVRGFLKDPARGGFKVIGKETLSTEIGKIKSLKVVSTVADPFVGKLVKQFTDNMQFWFEEGGSGKLLKFHADALQRIIVLDKVDIIKD